MDACILREIGKWVKRNEEAVYGVRSCDMKAENAIILQGKDCYYAIIKDVPMYGDPNVQRVKTMGQVRVEGKILSAEWLDNAEKIQVQDNAFSVSPFLYGESYFVRVAKLKMDI